MRVLLFLSFICWTVSIQAQSVILSYQDVHTGRNVNLIYRSADPHHQVYGGLKFQISRLQNDNELRLFKKRIYAANFVQHMGLRLGYQYQIPLSSRSRLSFFYDHQLTRSATRSTLPVPIGTLDTTVFYLLELTEFEVVNVWEQTAGLGLEAHMTDKVFMAFQAGIGSAFFWSIPETTTRGEVYDGPRQLWQLAYTFSLGLGYRLGD
jgi:hypothetical protein